MHWWAFVSKATFTRYNRTPLWRLTVSCLAGLSWLFTPSIADADDVSVLQRATSAHPTSPHDNPLGYAAVLEDAYLATRPTPAWSLPGEHLEMLSYSPIGMTLYESNGLPRLRPWALHQASAWAMLWSGAGLIAGTAMWAESGEPLAVTEAAAGGALIGAPLGFLLGSAESSLGGLHGGRMLPDNVRITLTVVQLERAVNPLTRPAISYAVLPAVVGEFF